MGYIAGGIGLVILIYNTTRIMQASSTKGCESILRESERSSSSGGSFVGGFLGATLANALGGGGSETI